MNQDGDVTIDAAGAMSLKAKRDLTLEGQNVKIKGLMKTTVEAGTQAEVSGLTAKLQGKTSVSVQSNAITEIKGTLVKIN